MRNAHFVLLSTLLTLSACAELEARLRPAPEPAVELPELSSAAPAAQDVDELVFALEGYGIRLVLEPPFQIAAVPPPTGARDQLIVSQWDVDAPGAGGGDVAAGLRSITLLPSLPDTPEAEISRTNFGTDDDPSWGYQLGVHGTRVLLGGELADLAGVAHLEKGPLHEGWQVRYRTETAPWPEDSDKTLQSSNPGAGSSYQFVFIEDLGRPWGPWR